jgi:hypothetical protein
MGEGTRADYRIRGATIIRNKATFENETFLSEGAEVEKQTTANAVDRE